jgi:hypothetical protein
MAEDRSQASRGTWRGKSEPKPAARAKKADHKWTKRGAKPEGTVKGQGSRTFRVSVGLTAFGACLMLLLWLIWMINPPQPAAVILVGADYAANLAVPHNVMGWQGLMGIERLSRTPRRWSLFNPASLQLIRSDRGKTLDRADQWDELIADLKKGFGEPTLILVLAMHGGSDANGPYLIPNLMKRPEDRLDLKKVISSMKDLPAEKRKILVVEGALVPSDWRLGMVHNDFPRRLKELEPEIRSVPNLWVLSGCDVDQRCWASEGLGRTVFSHYIIEALRGRNAAGPEGRLTLDELHRYVRENVRRWVADARGDLQEPVLLPGSADKGASKPAGTPARSDPADVYLAAVEGAPAPEPQQAPDREALKKGWLHFRQLDALLPHPAAYSPMRWRAYRATLVRQEQLIRAGASELAGTLTDQLAQLEQGMQKDRLLRDVSGSTETNLVMNAITGGSANAPPAPPEFLQLAEAPADAAEKIWSGLKGGAAASDEIPGQSRPMRSRLAEYLLGLAGSDPVKYLARATDRIKLANPGGDPLPAEAHFLSMIQANLQPPLAARSPSFWKLATLALQVRPLAERATLGVAASPAEYPYSEQVHLWTRGIIDEADVQRREGEDRLFAADLAAWNQARTSLTAAENRYQRALRLAGIIRAALSTRDRVLADLPDYSRWLVARPRDDLRDDLAGQAETLWTQTHRLADLLEVYRPDVEPAAIEQAGRVVDSGFRKLVERFVSFQRSATEKARLQEDSAAAAAAAAIAFADDDKLTFRTAIWDRLDNIRKNDLEVAAKVASSSTAATGGEAEAGAAERTSDLARRRASLQATLALGALGQRWFGDPAFHDLDQGDYQKTLEHVRALPGQEPDRWSKEAAREGDRIGLRFRTLRGEIDKLASEEQGITRFDAFVARLAQADRLARLVDRGDDPLPGSAIEPGARYRQARVRDFLVWMANRVWLDHWSGEKPQAKPYYQEIAGQLLGDAEKLFPALRDEHQKLRERITSASRLGLDGPASLLMTSELEALASYRVVDSGPTPVPAGIPVVRPRPDPLVQIEEGATDFRVAPRQQEGAPISFRLASSILREAEQHQADNDSRFARPVVLPASLTIDGFFRGQLFQKKTGIELHPVPDAVALGPAPMNPNLASIAVSASDEIISRFGQGTGAITIVLDCSGSMLFAKDPSGAVRPTLRKWPDAKNALVQVLKQVPAGTTVSIWTFSQLPERVAVGGDGLPVADPAARQQVEAAEANPETTIKPLRTPSAWDPNQVNELAARLDQLHPYFDTPLVEAMSRAADDLKSARGLKTLLVLTDGQDNRFKQPIPAFIESRFRPLGIRINMVYFIAAGKEEELKELQAARETFTRPLAALDPPGTFVAASKFDELILTLKRAIRQELVCQVARADGSPLEGEPLVVTNPEEDLRWWTSGLPAATYKLSVQADRTYGGEVDLQNGDRLIVKLVEGTGGGIAFERAIYGDDEDFRGAPKATDLGDWRLTVLSSQALRQSSVSRLRLLVAVESKSTMPPLRQIQPALVAFQLGIDGTSEAPPVALRWRALTGYPAQVWQLDVPSWPADPADAAAAGRPILSAWWWDRARPVPGVEFERDEAGGTQQVRDDDNQVVTVEDVRLENHLVELQPGEPPQLRSCLVIRLAYPKDSPYFVDPEPIKKLDTAGFEHRFYSQAGKYAGLFWPVNPDQLQKLKRLKVVSMNRVRREAAKRKNTAEMKLPRPRGDGKPPQPPLAIVR